VRRARSVMLGAVVVLGALVATIAVAQEPVPTVAVTASPTTVALQPAGPVPAGPTRFEVARQGNRDVSVYFGLLNAGVSMQEFQAALRSDDRSGGDSTLGLVSIQASISVGGSERRHGATFTLKPGLTYVVLSEADEDGGGNRPRQRGIATFTTSGQSNGATVPAPEARVRMVGLRFRGDRVLPRRGVVRVENGDGVPHFAIGFPLRRRVTSRQFGRALRSDSERAFGRVVAGAPYGVQGIISGGNTANDQEVRFPRAGRYGLVCFFGEHHRLGMYRVVTVR
jgi:hypothetical protein